MTGKSSGFCWLARCFLLSCIFKPTWHDSVCGEESPPVHLLPVSDKALAYMHTPSRLPRYSGMHAGNTGLATEGKKEQEREIKLSVSAPSTANTVAAGDVMHGTSNRPTAQFNALLVDKRQKADMELECCAEAPSFSRARTWRQ